MRCSLLGPVEIVRDRHVLELGPRQRRVLLIRLLIEDGRSVSLTELCHALWQDDQPAAAVPSIRAHVSRLRSALDPARHGRSTVLVSTASGYALKVPREARDTVAFEELVAQARTALREDRTAEAREAMESALALWRGEPLDEAAEHPFALREIARLNTARQDARELLTTILMRQGDMIRAIEVAEQLTATAPLREASWSLLMRALYAAGRPVDALRRYQRFRGMLARELGVDPSPALRSLHTAVLRHDATVLATARPPRPGTPATLQLKPLEPAPMPLVGRAGQTARLQDLMRAAASGGTRWAVVSGKMGTGKSRLLDEAAALATREGFTVTRAGGAHALGPTPDAPLRCPLTQLWDRLPGRTPAVLPRDGGPVEDEDTVTAFVRDVGREPTLCVIDDLDRAAPEVHEQLVRLAALLRGVPVVVLCALRAPATASLGTLLAELTRLDTAWLPLDPLTAGDVDELLTARGERVSAARTAALHRRCAGNAFVLGELLKLPPEQRTGPAARVPASVHALVQARLATVPTAARTMLAHAAADGGRLDIPLLAGVQRIPHERLLHLIDNAVTAELLHWHPESGARSPGHYHLPELVHEVLLDAQAPSTRQLLHAALARELTERPGTDPARLAGHLHAAGPMAPAAAPPPSCPTR